MAAFIEAKYAKQAKQTLGLLEAADPDSAELPFYRAVLAYEGEKNPRTALNILAQVKPDNPNYDKALGFRIQIALEIGDMVFDSIANPSSTGRGYCNTRGRRPFPHRRRTGLRAPGRV